MIDMHLCSENAVSIFLKETASGSLKYTITSDLDLSRKFGSSFMLVSEKAIGVLDSKERLVLSITLPEVKEVKVEELFGSGAVDLHTESGVVRALYFSKAMFPEFGALVRNINNFIREGLFYEPASTPPAHCPKCGRQLPERGAVCPTCVPRMKVILRLLRLLGGEKRRLIILVALTVITVVARMYPPMITKTLVDDVVSKADVTRLFFWIAMMAATVLLQFISEVATGKMSAWLSGLLVSRLRSDLHAHIQKLGMKYFNEKDSGEIVSRVMHDTEALQHFLVDGVPYIVVNGIMFFGIAGILVYLDPVLAAIVFLPVPVLLSGGRWFMQKMHPLRHAAGSIRGRLHTTLSESINGIKTIKAFSREHARSEAFSGISMRLFGIDYTIETIFLVFTRGMFWIMSIGVVLCWYTGVLRIIGSHKLTLGELFAFIGFIWLFYGPIQWMSAVLNWLTYAFASAERIFTVLDEVSEDSRGPASHNPGRFKGAIEFKGVHFSYERGKEVLKDLTFVIQPGEMIGLVGKSGAGKSTLINLICRFWTPDSGKILLDGYDIKDLLVDEYRHQIGIVMQEPFLFRASILDNIRIGVPHAGFKDVVSAARAANAHEFIVSKEDGYDTIVGDGGEGLSGGEKQRISIARAILHNPPILILDEATSSVDIETEKRIQEAITNLVKDRTTIAIAHRLSTLRNANRLFVIDEGSIVEHGSHDELMARGGIYANLVRTQNEVNRLKSEQSVWNE